MSDKTWIEIGLGAQALFTSRFVLQWLVSERKGRSYVPLAFWYLSVAGGGMLFVYALHRRDLVFSLGQGGGLLIYVRNLFLIYRRKREIAQLGLVDGEE